MLSETLFPQPPVDLFVKNILVFEGVGTSGKTVLPFFADGYPGLIFHETTNGLTVTPHQKRMPSFFLYGQTIKPIELVMEGDYKLMIFQLYPFVIKSFFNIEPQTINDNCYDLLHLQDSTVLQVMERLRGAKDYQQKIDLLSGFLLSVFAAKKELFDVEIMKSVGLILENKGQISIAALSEQLGLHVRTFERRFRKEIGLTPKQFCGIIQFQESLEHLKLKKHESLTDIVYANGFADQSHFIRVFKAFTGKTPKKF